MDPTEGEHSVTPKDQVKPHVFAADTKEKGAP